ncbi:MAG: hypothetical protein ACREDH_13385, partial [Methylocella sp.]
MAVELDLADIQGNILTAYGKQGFPKGRVMVFHIDNADSGRKFVTALLPMITTALRWKSKQRIPTGKIEVQRPEVAVNIAFTWYGLLALKIPTRTLRGMPDEFIDGMIKRAPMLGDNFREDWQTHWDEVWVHEGLDPESVHILIMLNAQMNSDGSAVAALDTKTREIETLSREIGRVRLLAGHNPRGQRKLQYQELSALLERKPDGTATATPKEHFGFTDAIGDPVFDGQYPDDYEQTFKIGNGALDGKGNWRPLATGEFLLGYPDEAQEIAGAAMPHDFSRNGTFVAYRKLHQNVAAFRTFLDKTAEQFGAVAGIENSDHARQTLMAKMAGRWPDGVPVSRAPTVAEWDAFNKQYPAVDYHVDPAGAAMRYAEIAKFTFGDDKGGTKCPLSAHVRRANTRDMLDPSGGKKGSVLNNRRRILRRGLPYGESLEGTRDEDEHGIVMLIVCAGLFRQFEFVQQQWLN